MNFKTVIANTQLVRTTERLIFENKIFNDVYDVLGNKHGYLVFCSGVYVVLSMTSEKTFHISRNTILYNHNDISHNVSKKFILKMYGKMKLYKEFTDSLKNNDKKK